MSYQDYAREMHDKGCNCCQSVLCSCCERFGMTQETACRLGAFFNGGMRQGEVCGAASGALMALGLAYGDENNRRSRKSIDFLNAFKADNGSIICRELLGPDGTKRGICDQVIAYAARYLEEEFQETDPVPGLSKAGDPLPPKDA